MWHPVRLSVWGLILALLFLSLFFAAPIDASSSSVWIQLSPTGGPPPPRSQHTSVYDPASNRLIIFGGCTNVPGPCNTFGRGASLNDLWVLANANGQGETPTWIQLTPTGGPPPARFRHAAVYDSANNRMVIWGGDSTFGSLPDLTDVWVLTNANGLDRATRLPATPNWSQLFPSGGPPTSGVSFPGREVSTSVYDSNTNRMIVFGGDACDPCTFKNDVWVLTNANGLGGTPQWLQLFPTGGPPAPRTYHSAVYDAAGNRMIIFGGLAPGGFGSGPLNDTWVLANASGVDRGTGTATAPVWTQLATMGTLPPARGQQAAAYDAATNRMVIFGGFGVAAFLNDVWLLDNANGAGVQASAWSQILPTGPAPAPRILFYNYELYDRASSRMLLFGGESSGGVAFNDSWVLTEANGSPPISSFAGPSQTNPVQLRGEPVNTATGNYYYQHTDLAIPGRGVPLLFQRTYNSLDTYSGPLGANWTHSFNAFLTASATTAIIKWGDGHGDTFTLSGGTYIPQPGVFSTLIKNTDGTFVLTRKDQTRFNFSSSGRFTSIQDKNGNMVTLIYNGSGNLTQITDTVGRNLALSYDSSKRITQITDPISRAVSFQYDVNNNLVQATDPASGITTFAYDSSHRVTSITQPNGQTLLTNVYDTSGRVTTQTGGRGFSGTFAYDTPNTGETTFTDARGNQPIDKYDSSLRTVKITDAASGTTSFTYDANNDRTSVTNQKGKTTNFSYDSLGNVTGITDPLSNTVAFTYDAKNDLLTATNAKTKTTTFTYDATGNLKTIQDTLANTSTLAYDSFGELSTKTDARGNATTYSYDAFGNLTRITDALGHSTTLAYDSIGRLTSISDPNDHAATATYDVLSRLVKIADPLAHQTQFVYDTVGNLLKITDANGNATNYAYDATNNLVSVTDALGHVTRYAYDADNNRVTFTNAKGNATSYAYDALNRLSRITDPLSFATSYSYDPAGSVLAITDAKGQTNQFTYDALNRLLTIAYADGKNVAYSYDANGNRTNMVDSHGATTYAYDALDRLISVTNPGGKVVTYAYDAVGNRKSLTYPDGKPVNYSFDTSNRLAAVKDWLGRTTTYSYDAASNLTGTLYPNSAALGFSYDAANRLAQVRNRYRGSTDLPLNPVTSFSYLLDGVGNRLQVTDGSGKSTNYGYDALNELISVTVGTNVTRFAYDAVGNRLNLTAPGAAINYSYDVVDRLLAAGTSTFTYDADGNQTSKTQTATGQPIVYAYDAANRLIRATFGAVSSAFSYDGDGNRISQSVGTGTYNYLNDVATALPVALQESGPDGNISYAYGLGLISESSSAFDYFYNYDCLGSIVGLTDSAGKLAGRYVYDAWGQPDLWAPGPQLGTKNKFRFTGEALDPGTQLYYFRARYYDPNTARFLSQDPLRTKTSAYAYVRQNPVSSVDLSGLSGTLTIYSQETWWIPVLPGHSWISYTPDSGPDAGKTTTYGVWVGLAGPFSSDTGLHENLEAELNYQPFIYRSTYLSDFQEASLFAVIQEYKNWGSGAWAGLAINCSSFAAQAWYRATGEWINPYDLATFSTPNQLTDSILAANGGEISGILQQKPVTASDFATSIAGSSGK